LQDGIGIRSYAEDIGGYIGDDIAIWPIVLIGIIVGVDLCQAEHSSGSDERARKKSI